MILKHTLLVFLVSFVSILFLTRISSAIVIRLLVLAVALLLIYRIEVNLLGPAAQNLAELGAR